MKAIGQFQHDGKTFLDLYFNEEINYLYGDWSGFISRHQAIEGCTAMLAWAKEHARALGCVAMVNDSRKVRGSWDTALDWVEKNFSRPMYELGFRWNAVVLSKDLSAQVSAEKMAASNRPGAITFRLTMTLLEAEEWLESMRRA